MSFVRFFCNWLFRVFNLGNVLNHHVLLMQFIRSIIFITFNLIYEIQNLWLSRIFRGWVLTFFGIPHKFRGLWYKIFCFVRLLLIDTSKYLLITLVLNIDRTSSGNVGYFVPQSRFGFGQNFLLLIVCLFFPFFSFLLLYFVLFE